MWLDLYEFTHDTLGMCFWTLPALITAGIMVIVGLVHWRNQRKRDKEFEERMEQQEG